MRSRLLRVLVALAVLTGLNLAGPPAASAAPYCGLTWGSLPRSTAGATAGSFAGVRTGRHDCYDRLVVDVTAPVQSFDVRYVDGLGSAVPGGAQLEVVVGTRTELSHTWMFHYDLATVTSSRTFRAVKAGHGGGETTSVWLGVRARLPFRAFVLDGGPSGSRLVVDVAHQWCVTGTTC